MEVTKMGSKEQQKLTSEQEEMRLEEKKKRAEVFAKKRDGAMANLVSKVNALGDDALLDEFETAAYLGRSVQWLRLRRTTGATIPPVIKIGTGVRYRFGALKAA
jgi:hypothetical protein